MSATIKEIREKYPNIPILGIKPAIKPALLDHPNEKILVMATEETIKLEKFNKLRKELNDKENIIPIICNGLAWSIENNLDVTNLLKEYLLPYRGKVSVVVLGCTHYPFVKNEIKKILENVTFYDGSYGMAKHLKKQLKIYNKINSSKKIGKVIFESSNNCEQKYKDFYNKT